MTSPPPNGVAKTNNIMAIIAGGLAVWTFLISPIQDELKANRETRERVAGIQERISKNEEAVAIVGMLMNVNLQYAQREAAFRDNIERVRDGRPEVAVPAIDFWPNAAEGVGGRE